MQSGGAFWTQCNSFSCSQSNFSDGEAGHRAFALHFDNTENPVQISCCVFTNGKPYSSTNTGGGALSLMNDTGACVCECYFSNISSRSNASAVGISSTTNLHSKLFFCFFEKNVGDASSDVLTDNASVNCLQKEDVIFCLSLSTGTKPRVMIGTSDCSTWIPQGFNTLKVDVVHGENNRMCGHGSSDYPYPTCKTIEYTIQVADHISGLTTRVDIAAGAYTEEGMNVNNLTMNFCGASNQSTSISSSIITLFQISTGSASLSKLTIVRNSSASISTQLFSITQSSGRLNVSDCIITAEATNHNPFATSLFSFSCGAMTFSDVKFKSMKFISVSAIAIDAKSSENLVFHSVDFISIVRNEGNGAVFEKTIQRNEVVTFYGMNASNCICLKGSGGCVWLSVESGGEVIIGKNSEMTMFSGCTATVNNSIGGFGGALFFDTKRGGTNFVIQNLTFGTGGNENKADLGGKNIFIDSQKLSSVVTSTTFQIILSSDSTKNTEAMGFEEGFRDIPIPLAPYLMRLNEKARVGGSQQRDFSACGFSSYPCETISYAASLRYSGAPKTIILNSGFIFKESMELNENNWTIECGIMGTEINIQGNGQVPAVGMIHVTKATKMSNISFCLPASLLSTSTLIACSAESLELKNCGAKLSSSGSSELEYDFVRASHSTLVLNTFTVNTQLSFASNSMIMLRNGCNVNMNNCAISEVEKSNGNGGFFESTGRIEGNYSCNIIVDNCTFISCKACSNNACGGGLFVELKENEKLIVNGSTTFDGCLTACVEHDTGKGGAVMISVSDASASFAFGENVLFSQSKANNATFGKDLFISCGTGIFLKEKTNFESLLFFDSSMEPDDLNQMSGTENGEDEPLIPIFVYFCTLVSSIFTDGDGGTDHPFCGFKGFMCKSIDYCFENRISSSVNEIDVDSTSFISNELVAMNCHFCLTSQTSEASVSFDDKGDKNCEALIVCELNSTVEISNLELLLPDTLQQKHISILESSSTLSLISISFVSINESISRQFGILRVMGGKFTMSDALFKGIFLFSGRSAIEICNEQVSNLNNCSLIGVKQYNGGGGCISVNMQIPTPTSVFLDNCTVSGECAEGSSLKGGGIFASLQSGVISIQNTMFDECKTPSSESEANGKGIGGGLYVYAIDDETELSLNKVMFHGCSGWKGDCVFVDGNNLSILIKKERFLFEWAELDEKDLMGFERSTTSSSVELLLGAFLTPFEVKGFVSGDGEGLDHSGCGLRAYPCRTVPHLLKRRFQTISSTTAEIIFTSSYSIKDAFVIESYSACFESEMEGIETVIEEDGTGVADGLIETRNVVSFSCIKFSLPSQFAVERICLFLCSSSILTLQKCSAQLKGGVGKIEYSFVKVVNGEAHLYNFSFYAVKFGDTCAVHIRGNDGRGIMNASEFNEVESDSSSGLIFVSNGCYFEEVNSTIRESIFEKCCAVYCENGSGMKMINSSLKNLTRKIGNGGGLTGIVGNGKTIEIKNSSFIGIRCLATNSLGGCVFVNVGNDGGFYFESNNISECSVNGQQGYGGGVYFSLESPSAKYTMRSIQFSQNSAKYGSDIFLLSAAPRQVLQADLWDGTVLESSNSENFWVMDLLDECSINQSIKPYLFPEPTSVLFVKFGGTNNNQCGAFDYPCGDMIFGLGKMTDEMSTIHINESIFLEQRLSRSNLSLSIRGNDEKSYLNVSEGGCFEQKTGDAHTTLAFNKIIFILSENPTDDVSSLIAITVGRVVISSCECGSSSGPTQKSGASIVSGTGEVKFSFFSINNVLFSRFKGICAVSNGMLAFEYSNVSSVMQSYDENKYLNGIEQAHNGLVVGCGNSKILLNGSSFKNCVSEWSVINARGIEALTIGGESQIDECSCLSTDGGGIYCQLVDNGKMTLEECCVTFCSANVNTGKGGGLYLLLEREFFGNYVLKNMKIHDNVAKYGMDVFIECESLNKSISASHFQGLNTNEEILEVKMQGLDREKFVDEPVNLSLFLEQRLDQVICVSADGYDMIGCGTNLYPCCSFWRGYRNLVENSEDKELQIVNNTVIDSHFEIDYLTVKSTASGTQSIISISKEIPASDSMSLLNNKGILLIEDMIFDLPDIFVNEMKSVIESSGTLSFKSSSFTKESDNECSYNLILINGGTFLMKNCEVSHIIHNASPFNILFASSATMEECNFEGIGGSTILKGGHIRAALKDLNRFSLHNCSMNHCICSGTEGKGGAVFLDCLQISNANSFSFNNTMFASNKAAHGSNIYIFGSDLNFTVNNNSFSFDYASYITDENPFFGENEQFGMIDLLLLLVPFNSPTVYVSTDGFDIAGCGDHSHPCSSFLTGFYHVEDESISKEIIIHGSTLIQNHFDLDSFSVHSDFSPSSTTRNFASADALIDISSLSNLTIDVGVNDSISSILSNSETLLFSSIRFCVLKARGDSQTTVISNGEGYLSLDYCILECHTAGNTETLFCFILMKSGELFASSLQIERITLGKCLINIMSGSVCSFQRMTFDAINMSTSGLVFIEEKTEEHSSHETRVAINESTFRTLTGDGEESCAISSISTESVQLSVNKTSFITNHAKSSQKGGAIFFALNEGGWLKMTNSEIIESCCNENSGKGGGVYLHCTTSGEVDFIFHQMSLLGNAAFVGRDIFVECFSIENQINETQFRFDLRPEEFIRANAIWGRDSTLGKDVDLMDYITTYQSTTIIVSSVHSDSRNFRNCGKSDSPCYSVDYGLNHILSDFDSRLYVDKECIIEDEFDLDNLTLRSKVHSTATLSVVPSGTASRDELIFCSERVQMELLNFVFPSQTSSSHECLIKTTAERCFIKDCSFEGKDIGDASMCEISFSLIEQIGGTLELSDLTISSLSFVSTHSVLQIPLSGNCYCKCLEVFDICIPNCEFCSVCDVETSYNGKSGSIDLSLTSFKNLNCSEMGIISVLSAQNECPISFSNCTFKECNLPKYNGKLASFGSCSKLNFTFCLFEGYQNDSTVIGNSAIEDVCHWNGSLICLTSCTSYMKDTTVANSSKGGISVSKGRLTIEMGMFEGNNPSIERYPSARRNIICDEGGIVDVMSFKGGDGLLPNSSMWILNEGCEMEGIALERTSVLFIPHLERVEQEEAGAEIKLKFIGNLLMPCSLQFRVTTTLNEEKLLHTNKFEDSEYVNESEVVTNIQSSLVKDAPSEAEVSVCILFGDEERPLSTQSFVLKNKSEPQTNANGKLAKEGSGTVSSWALIVIFIFVMLFLIVLIVSIIFIVRWRKAKNENKDLREIVNDNIRKEPKAFEMVTMEMSPEEQWRRAEREAEKKNEERIKKRVYDSNMEHSESSEHLLSESGSTEYILGRDSDKIPEWMLEKVDEKEEEETRKRIPSPSISSTSTTDTSDTESTFVRSESLCPTTSSMSNLVDAIACSSVFEKLIVDLRDSLFMLLHGRNEKKEMAIGTLKEREHTAAQVLFWVANGALHSFENEEDELSSLAHLSPHIVLFSEHMIICIAKHSDFSSDDSDSSSISSASTIITSSSDFSTANRNGRGSPPPSSAFEDDSDNKKECLRWKAPELQMNKKMGATKESVSFSIGMMLWECLTLQIPFGEYEAEVAGQKIVNGERPDLKIVEGNTFEQVTKNCLSASANDRPPLSQLKREFIQRFPDGTVMMTISDAVDLADSSGDEDITKRGNVEIDESGYF